MPNHHVKLFIVDRKVFYIHHNIDIPSDDDPGIHARGQTTDKVRFRSRDDGPFTIEFKNESPFISDDGSPGSPISSKKVAKGDETDLETLKPILTVTKRFPYTVKIGGLTDDPEIIIDNSGGGGAKKKKKKK